MKTKTFDAVEMKRHAARRIHTDLAAMTTAQRRAYWQAGGRELRQLQQALRQQAERGHGGEPA